LLELPLLHLIVITARKIMMIVIKIRMMIRNRMRAKRRKSRMKVNQTTIMQGFSH